MRCSAVVKYLRIVGSIYNRPWIKKNVDIAIALNMAMRSIIWKPRCPV